ncbi:MAG: hypothetical protein KJO40_09505 [Deltaproteobacteria bacterium]|nr:hypothetical protein [Deltaproteobacteria bacterium]NND29027.1 hypothetical protein [Myxococcales bacterium]MBT8463966.1 hypothetical protein [Deltaproteobacteria bacterium]NNK07762.1 hypothetical protein [Myxococcales bacterium]NNK43472.1 hypothetical protein [Myxococcales bacterium]
MRNLLYFGLFALALTVVGEARADDHRDYRRGKKVIVTYDDAPRRVAPVRTGFEPSRATFDQRRTFHPTPQVTQFARRAYFEQRKDLEQIVRISERWERAVATRNPDAQWKVNRRLDAWLEREIRESMREPRNQRYTHRIRLLRNELVSLERTRLYRRGHQGRGRGVRGYHGRAHGGYFATKASILDQLISLSERQVQIAEVRVRAPYRLSFARR